MFGYPRKPLPNEDARELQISYKGSSATVTRICGKQTMVLLNLLYAPQGSALSELADLLLCLDNLSHCLVWTRSTAVKANQEASIDVIEFPRLNLHFEAKVHPDAKVNFDSAVHNKIRLYSVEHVGLFISNDRCKETEELLNGLPNSLLLENIEGELFVLVAASWKPQRPDLESELFPSDIVFQHGNEDWLKNLSVRYYLYPIHLSRSFMFRQTLSASLYLLLMRLLHRQYGEAFKVADMCIKDTVLSAEEQQIFDLINKTLNNADPDATALRLKISLISFDSSMKCVWNLAEEFDAYIRKLDRVSSECRFTPDEEASIMEAIGGEGISKSLHLRNRLSLLQCIRSKLTNFQLNLPARPRVVEFDPFIDDTWMRSHSLSSSWTTSYKRPLEKEALNCLAVEAMSKLNSWLDQGINLAGKHSLGFLFFYELMTGTLDFRIMPRDNSFHLGCALLRFLPAQDTNQKSYFISILKLLSNNSQIARNPTIPLFKDSKMRFATMSKLGWNGFSQLLKELPKYLETIKTPSFDIKWPEYATQSTKERTQIVAPVASRKWLCPRVANYECSQRVYCTLDQLSNNNPLEISGADLTSFIGFPLSVLNLGKFVVTLNRDQRGLEEVSPLLPFDVSRHPSAQTHVAKSMVTRLINDCKIYAKQENTVPVPKMCTLLDSDIDEYINNPAGSGSKAAVAQIELLVQKLQNLKRNDTDFVGENIQKTVELANSVGSETTKRAHKIYLAARSSGTETSINFPFLIASLMSTSAESDLRRLNPFTSVEQAKRVFDLTVSVLLHAIRIGQTSRSIAIARNLLAMLKKLRVTSKKEALEETSIRQGITLEASMLAQNLTARRFFISKHQESKSVVYDPRFLVAEFIYNLMLRQSQVELVLKFMKTIQSGQSICQQMIMVFFFLFIAVVYL